MRNRRADLDEASLSFVAQAPVCKSKFDSARYLGKQATCCPSRPCFLPLTGIFRVLALCLHYASCQVLVLWQKLAYPQPGQVKQEEPAELEVRHFRSNSEKAYQGSSSLFWLNREDYTRVSLAPLWCAIRCYNQLLLTPSIAESIPHFSCHHLGSEIRKHPNKGNTGTPGLTAHWSTHRASVANCACFDQSAHASESAACPFNL